MGRSLTSASAISGTLTLLLAQVRLAPIVLKNSLLRWPQAEPLIHCGLAAGAKAMMGERQTDHPALFYEFSLERHVPGDHLLRSIDRFVDPGDIREQLRPFYSDTGRPSVDPELMIRMLIVGSAWASAQSGACAKRFTSISPIAGSAGWTWTARCRTTRPSLRTGTVAFARAICSASCSSRRSPAASRKGSSAAKASRWTRR